MDIIGIFFCPPFLPFVTQFAALYSSFKSRHVWCVSMYLCFLYIIHCYNTYVSLSCKELAYRLFTNGTWFELVVLLFILFIMSVGIPLFIQLKTLNRKTFLVLMWLSSLSIFPIYAMIWQAWAP